MYGAVMRIYIAGINGMVGSALNRAATAQGHVTLGRISREVDFRDRQSTFAELESNDFDTLIIAAAKVGGIVANNDLPVDFLSENLQIQTNLIDAAHACDIPRLVFLGSSCIYPKFAPQPIQEESLLTGTLEPTNEAYAIAKIAGLTLVNSYRKQHGRHWISVMPTNLYGPGDNFNPHSSHVIPGLIQKFENARALNSPFVTLWGDGSPRREFLHVDDLARAVLHAMQHHDSEIALNIGTGNDISIVELAKIIQELCGYEGEVLWDINQPNGTPRKLLDSSRIFSLGWRPEILLANGLQETLQWYRDSQEMI